MGHAAVRAGTRIGLGLLLLGWLVGLLTLPGYAPIESDTSRRLSVSHWLWSGESPIGTLEGVDGNHHPWYGIGQPLVMLPAEWLVTQGWQTAKGKPPSLAMRMTAVSYLLFPLLCGAALWGVFALLLRLGFSPLPALGGTLATLLASTFLWHTQNTQENPMQLALTAWAAVQVLAWRERPAETWRLTVAAALLGFNLLTRLTAMADAFAVLLLPLLLEGRRMIWRPYARQLLQRLLPIFALYLLADRLYHWRRFGRFDGTYMDQFGAWAKGLNPILPASFPFNLSPSQTLWDMLFSPSKALLLYDPLLLLVLPALLWGRVPAHLRGFLLAMLLLLAALMLGYSRYYCWSANSAWGNRFLATPVQLMVAASAAWLCLQWPRHIALRAAATGLLLASLLLQLSSLVYPSWKEEMDSGAMRRSWFLGEADFAAQDDYFQAGERLGLLKALVSGDCTANAPCAGPYLLMPMQPLASLPPKAVWAVKGGWWLLLALVLALMLRLRRAAKSPPEQPPAGSIQR